mgnify:CR=1 FL=1
MASVRATLASRGSRAGPGNQLTDAVVRSTATMCLTAPGAAADTDDHRFVVPE